MRIRRTNEELIDELVSLANKIIFDASLQGKYNKIRKEILDRMDIAKEIREHKWDDENDG